MKRLVMVVVLLAGCGPAGLQLPDDGGTDALPCAEQPCTPDDAGRCQRCPIEDAGQ
jgi:hypothetical protein